MIVHAEKLGFDTQARNRDGGYFVSALLEVIPLFGISEICRSGEEGRHLHKALGIINRNVHRRAKRAHQLGQTTKQRAWTTIGFEVAVSNIGSFDTFWGHVALAMLRRSGGYYRLSQDRVYARWYLKTELEPDYARFVKACARLIAKELRGR